MLDEPHSTSERQTLTRNVARGAPLVRCQALKTAQLAELPMRSVNFLKRDIDTDGRESVILHSLKYETSNPLVIT